jgi:hypothetical protein
VRQLLWGSAVCCGQAPQLLGMGLGEQGGAAISSCAAAAACVCATCVVAMTLQLVLQLGEGGCLSCWGSICVQG